MVSGYGDAVKTTKYVVRLVRGAGHSGSQAGHRPTFRDRQRYYCGPTLFMSQVEWPGEPLDGSDEPEGKTAGHSRLRRFEFVAVEHGLIVGQVWKQEGYTEPGSAYGGGYMGETDYDPPYFCPKRRFMLYEVALPPSRAGGRSRLVLVHPDDIEAAK